MNKEKALFIVGSFSLPRIEAGASRVIELSSGFKPYFDKIIISGKFDNSPAHQPFYFDDKIIFYPYHSVKFDGVMDKISCVFHPKKYIIPDLKRCLNNYNITHIMIYSALNTRTVRAIKKIAKKNRIKIIFDVVEFQTISTQTPTSFFTFYLPNVRTNKKIIKKGDNVISISSFLNQYFLAKDCNSVQIPFVFNTSSFEVLPYKPAVGCIRLMYAGSPKKGKDLLSYVIEGMCLVPDSILKNISLTIAGTSKDEFIKSTKIPKEKLFKIMNNVKFAGRISNIEVRELYQQSDFSVLIRNENDRLSKAGFPTKVSESLLNGTPVICNITSDLGQFLANDYNALIMNNSSPQEFARCIVEASHKTPDQLMTMRKNARDTSEQKLDVGLFDKEIKQILQE